MVTKTGQVTCVGVFAALLQRQGAVPVRGRHLRAGQVVLHPGRLGERPGGCRGSDATMGAPVPDELGDEGDRRGEERVSMAGRSRPSPLKEPVARTSSGGWPAQSWRRASAAVRAFTPMPRERPRRPARPGRGRLRQQFHPSTRRSAKPSASPHPMASHPDSTTHYSILRRRRLGADQAAGRPYLPTYRFCALRLAPAMLAPAGRTAGSAR